MGREVFGWAIVISMLASIVFGVLGIVRRRWLLLALAAVLAMFFVVPEALSIGPLLVIVPLVEAALALGYLIRGSLAVRAMLILLAGVVYFVVFVLQGPLSVGVRH